MFIDISFLRGLKDGKFGFTSLNLYSSKNEILNTEALMVEQTSSQQPTQNNSGLYNGGSGGGGGASGDF
ncbi:MAG: hypothetical protein M3139_12700 [Bacteroidota bacterium]|nr:hypothetical protein [Bacteroidota bacterium]